MGNPDILALRAVRDCGVVLATTSVAARRFDALCRLGLAWGVNVARGKQYRILSRGEAYLAEANRLA